MLLLDTHSHFDHPAFNADRAETWSRARAAGVGAALVPAVEPATWDRTVACALPGERFVALGIHPQALPDLTDADVRAGLDALTARARSAGAVAIGECGFDGGIDLARASRQRQREVFEAHVAVAVALDLPMVVHVVRAHREALEALRALRGRLPPRPGVVHSYSGGADLVRAYVDLGFHLGFGGAVTRPDVRRPVAALRAVPAERLLLETDAPDQIPTGTGTTGRRCEPAHVVVTARRVAELRGTELAEIAERTTANACALFGLLLHSPPR